MRTAISRWFMFGLLIGWSLTHTHVLGQPSSRSSEPKAAVGADQLRQRLDKVVTVDFTGQSFQEVVAHLRDRTGLPLAVDEQCLMMMGMIPGGDDGIIRQYQVKATNEKAGAVLRKFLNNYRLSYVLFEDTVLITTEELAVLRQMRQRVSVNIEQVAFQKVVRDLAKRHGINLVIDPAQATAADTPVSLQVDNTGIETAVRLLSELAGLKAVRMGNVMFVTSEAKAKKIREEESHQFDNPLNPQVPGGLNAFGFGGGVMPVERAVPGFAVPGNPGIGAPAIDLPAPAPGKDAPAEPGRDPVEAPVRKKVILPVPPQAPDAPPPTPPGIERPAPPRPPAQRRESN